MATIQLHLYSGAITTVSTHGTILRQSGHMQSETNKTAITKFGSVTYPDKQTAIFPNVKPAMQSDMKCSPQATRLMMISAIHNYWRGRKEATTVVHIVCRDGKEELEQATAQ